MYAQQGGSILATSREDGLLEVSENTTRAIESMVENLNGVLDILYVIGGDGSMRAAHRLAQAVSRKRLDLAVVGIPKTMDNDVLWVWQSFGFMSAVEQATEMVKTLHTEASSNPRLAVVQVYGSDSGFVAAHTAVGSGVCDAVLIPEVPFTLAGLGRHICGRLDSRRGEHGRPGSPHAVIVLGETAVPTDVDDFIGKVGLARAERQAITDFVARGRRTLGQTPDELRSGALKLVAGALKLLIRDPERPTYSHRFRVLANEPRQLIRAVAPSVADRILAERLGRLAVDGAMAGYTDFMISQWLTEYVLVPLELVVLGRKRVPTGGVFWKTVLESTGQPAAM